MVIPENKGIVDSRFCPRCSTHDVYLIFITEQNFVELMHYFWQLTLCFHCLRIYSVL